MIYSPNEGGIDEDNVVMLSYSDNTVDGPWFAYNHNGCGFLVKPDATSLSNDTGLEALENSALFSEITAGEVPVGTTITAAVQPFDQGNIYYFLDNGTYLAVSIDEVSDDSIISTSQAENGTISSWGISEPEETTDNQISGDIASAFTIAMPST